MLKSLVFLVLASEIGCSVRELYKTDGGELTVALVVQNCRNYSVQTPFVQNSLVNSAVWTVKRLNFLRFSDGSLSFGLKVYETCREHDELEAVFDLFKQNERELVIGLVSGQKPSLRARKLSQVLGIKLREAVKRSGAIVHASVLLLESIGWKENVTVIAPSSLLLQEFAKLARDSQICIADYLIINTLPLSLTNFTGNCIVFGNQVQINSFLHSDETKNDKNFIFVPTDGAILTDLPPNSFAIVPPHIPLAFNFKKSSFFATPLLFEVAIPLVALAEEIRGFLAESCNETNYKLNCLRTLIPSSYRDLVLEPLEIVELLKIEPLLSNFVYNIYKNENSSTSYQKAYTYSYFSKNLTLLDANLTLLADSVQNSCEGECKCKNFEISRAVTSLSEVRLRSESWVFAFLSLSLLGILLSIAVLVFFLVAICRRDILEGNPLMSILLLVAVVLIYASIIPLALEGSDSNAREVICLARSLMVTMSFCAAFSLLLSRSILLATASKETGFMAHLAGPVQSFLCLFIFGVQAALSLQILGRCSDTFRGFSFVYLLSYNAMLLLLLLCMSPLIYKCQRNYREGKYFTIAVGVVVLLWMAWLPAYVLMEEEHKELVLCFGLVSTASAIMGAVFVPRTYLMTIAAARDKITSNLPSLTTTTSAMDIYRTGTQPVYDCVNIAAINAVNVARAGVTTIQPSDLYTCPAFPGDDDEEYEVRCETPVSNDKVTRF